MIRKVLLVGVPATFPERGGTLQLVWGLLVCFISAGMYMMYAPYVENGDDRLSQLAQLQVPQIGMHTNMLLLSPCTRGLRSIAVQTK